jgi:peptide/nickel transport system ATP-binding protein
VSAGELLALVGKKGEGKSTALKVGSGQLRPNGGQVVLRLGGEEINLYGAGKDAFRRACRHLGVVDQNPAGVLNPERHIVDIVEDPLAIHRLGRRRSRRRKAEEMLDRVGLGGLAGRRPVQLSGGQQQRVCIARALVAGPQLCFLDEPTSSLDVFTQAELICLLRDLLTERRLAALLVTHDLGVVRQLCERTAVLSDGRVVEAGPTAEVFARPRSEAARLLLEYARRAALPRPRAESTPNELPFLKGVGRARP